MGCWWGPTGTYAMEGVESNGSEGYEGAGWSRHARGGGWGEVGALGEVGGQGRAGNGGRVLWEGGARVQGAGCWWSPMGAYAMEGGGVQWFWRL